MAHALTEAMLLDLGVQQKLIDAATATGTAKSQLFVTPVARDTILELIAKRTGAFTALTVKLEVSADGGTTWEEATAALDMLTQPTVQRVAIGGNMLCRLNVASFTGGTSVDVFGMAATVGGI